MRRRITKVHAIEFLSLCPLGANAQPVLYKEQGSQNLELRLLSKAGADFDEKGTITTLAYPADYVDADGDVASREVVEQMCHSFAKEGMKLDLRHDGKAVDRAKVHVVESWIVAKGDSRFADWKDVKGRAVDATGAWAVTIKVEDQDLRKRYRAGEWNGVSVGGRAEFEVLQKEQPMDFEKMLAELKKSFDTTLEPIKKDIAELKVKKGDSAGASGAIDISPPKDPTSIAEVKKALDTLKRSKAAKSIDWSDETAVEKHLAELEKQAEIDQKNEKPEQTIARLKKELADKTVRLRKAEGASSVPEGADLEKSDDDDPQTAYKAGRERARALQGGEKK